MAKRVIAIRTGGPEVLRLETYEPAAPGSGEVRVRNQACGVAFADVLLREGLYPGHKPPVVPGYDVVGRVVALGPDVASVKVGDYVAALTVIGGYASDVIVPAADLVSVPESLSSETAAALVLNGLTAYQMLERCCPANLSSIAVFGAAGGVGSILLDLARHRGLTAYGFGSRDKYPAIAGKGAIPLERGDPVKALRAVAPNGVDAVFDGVGGRNATKSFAMLGEGGTLVLFGAQGIMDQGRRNLLRIAREWLFMPRWSAFAIFGSNRGITGYVITLWKHAHPAYYRADLAAVFALAESGVVKPLIDTVVDLADAPAAHTRINEGRHTGKIVLRIGD
jgi:NADPH:quinone reductase-like Zn-dependent oxidoreductase